MQKIAAAQFKAQCLAVMDQVAQSGRAVLITKHSKPVVKLVPANEGKDEIFGALAGIARITGDIENTVPARNWGVECLLTHDKVIVKSGLVPLAM